MVGRTLVSALEDQGHDVGVADLPAVNTLTGAGVDAAVAGAQVVVDVTNLPDVDSFRTSATTLLAAESKAGVRHHVLLSIVGVDGDHDLDYYRAKLAQEEAVRNGGVPFTIVRSTQFFPFLQSLIQGDPVRLPTTRVQPIAVADLVALLAAIAVEPPAGGVVEVAGPDAYAFDDFARRLLALTGDPRQVVTDDSVRPMMGARMGERTLLPGSGAHLGYTDLRSWLKA
jgi:uncharacterized protein YbjT (DUF2867 family)